VVVLGAGIVGTCAALDLQDRGRAVFLIDRRDRAGAETSFGNAGLIERSSIFPPMFPRNWRAFLRYAGNLAPEAHYHVSALPRFAPWLWRYFRNSAPEPAARIAAAARPLVERCLAEHELWARRAGVADQIRRTGWIKLFRSPEAFVLGAAEARRLIPYGLAVDFLDRAELAQREPALLGDFAGAIHFRDSASIADPGGLTAAYCELFQRRGGRLLVGDARTLAPAGAGWTVTTRDGPVTAREAVVALGPWSADVLDPLGYRIPLMAKRGYHAHFEPVAEASLRRPVALLEAGFVLSPMAMGVRMTTGAEFARRDAPPTPVQVDRAEPVARSLLPLGRRIEAKPWLGSRPCLPDMLPVIGRAPRHPNLWLDFGHHHHGLTLGPVSARLLGESMTGADLFADPSPYRADRF
jgi:D-amino-acid dehydrogenase